MATRVWRVMIGLSTLRQEVVDCLKILLEDLALEPMSTFEVNPAAFSHRLSCDHFRHGFGKRRTVGPKDDRGPSRSLTRNIGTNGWR